MGTKTSLNNTPQANDDAYSWTEDQLLGSGLLSGNAVNLDVTSNDLGGQAKSLFSIDDGNGHTSATDYDLLNADQNGVWEFTSSGDRLRIYNGQIQLDLSASLAALGASDVNSLAAGDHIHDEFVYAIRLGNGTVSQAKVAVDISGQNDAATITQSAGDDTTVSEAGGLNNSIAGDSFAAGQLTIIDVDHGQNRFQPVDAAALVGHYGGFTFDPLSGMWAYTLDQTKADPLTAGQPAIDTLTVASVDGTATKTITVTIIGANDQAAIGGTLAGDVTEDGVLSTGGTVTVNDVDAGQNFAVASSSLHGTYGDFTYDGATGAWTYTLRDSDANVQDLAGGAHVHDLLTLTSADGTDSRSIDVTVTGADERAATIFYVTNDQLWVTDGTPGSGHALEPQSGTFLRPTDLVTIGDELFFNGDFHTGRFDDLEVWKSDGTTAGTLMVSDIRPELGTSGSNPSNLTNVGGTLFFFADDGVHGRELWKSDGSSAEMVADINPGSGSGTPSYGLPYLTDVGGKAFFVANDGMHGNELWVSDGTPGGTQMLTTTLDDGGFGPTQLTNVNGTLYFTANDSVHGWELWKSDGTPGGTAMVEDLNPNTLSGDGRVRVQSSSPQMPTNVNGTLFYVATAAAEGDNGNGPWDLRTLGAGQDHSVFVKQLPHQFGHDLFSLPTVSNGLLYFGNVDSNAINSHNGLWRSDGTAAGTFEIVSFNRGIGNATNNTNVSDHVLADVNGTLYFAAKEDPAGGTDFHDELWKTNGATASLVHDFGDSYSRLDDFTNVNGVLYFAAVGPSGSELWKSDGTDAGTVLLEHGIDYTQGILHL